MPHNIFFDVSIVLGITISVACIVRLLRQPMLIAYIVTGIIAGPLVLDLITDSGEALQTFAEFGVILLLFMVGLSLNMSHIKAIGKVSTITGLAQVLFTASVGTVIGKLLGFSWTSAIYLAVALTFSSTIIIIKLMSDKKDTETVYGRHVIGLMIVQDIVAIAIMIALATFRDTSVSFGEHIGVMMIRSLALLSVVYLLSRYALSWILDRVARSGEFLFIFTVSWCFWLASLLYWAGFSLEIGAIIAGLTLGSSKYQMEISSRIKPLRDFFIVLFFVILGAEMVVSDLQAVLIPGIIFSLFILIGNPLILYVTFRMLKFTRRNSFLAGITAAQVSEFGFILLFTGAGLGHVFGFELSVFTVVAIITIFVSSYLITYSEQLYRMLIPIFQLFGKDRHQQTEEVKQAYDVWVFGYHRIGWRICEELKAQGISFAVVDYNPTVLTTLKHRGIPAYFGDVADVEFLENLHFEKSKMVISTIPTFDDQQTLVAYVKQRAPRVRIIANLYDIRYVDEVYRAGADFVMMPHLLGGQWASEVLLKRPWTTRTFTKLKQMQKQELRLRHTTSGV